MVLHPYDTICHNRSKLVCVGLVMTTSTKVGFFFLLNTMSIRQRKKLNVLKETHVVVFTPCGNQHHVQWQQRCHKVHHGRAFIAMSIM